MYKPNVQKRISFCRWKRPTTLMVSLLLLLCVTVGGTLAYLVAQSEPVKNVFQPSEVTTEIVEKLDGGMKSNVQIQNTGDIPAYIRAAVIMTWKDETGNVYGELPKPCEVSGCNHETCDGAYAIQYSDENWEQWNDNFYYYTKIVDANALTSSLIDSCEALRQMTVTNEDGTTTTYGLSVEIIGSAIQAEGTDSDGNKPIELAWGVDIDENGRLKQATIEQ